MIALLLNSIVAACAIAGIHATNTMNTMKANAKSVIVTNSRKMYTMTILCWILGHEPQIERRGDDSVMICSRCNKPVDYENHRLIVKDNVFVKDVYKN